MAESLVTLEELTQTPAEAPFLRHYRFAVASRAHGPCELIVSFDALIQRPVGIISGMATIGTADVSTWLAITTMRVPDERWVTSDMQTALLRSGRAESVPCKVQVLRLGPRSACGTAECHGVKSGALLAHRTVRYAKLIGAGRA